MKNTRLINKFLFSFILVLTTLLVLLNPLTLFNVVAPILTALLIIMHEDYLLKDFLKPNTR